MYTIISSANANILTPSIPICMPLNSCSCAIVERDPECTIYSKQIGDFSNCHQRYREGSRGRDPQSCTAPSSKSFAEEREEGIIPTRGVTMGELKEAADLSPQERVNTEGSANPHGTSLGLLHVYNNHVAQFLSKVSNSESRTSTCYVAVLVICWEQ